IIESNSEAELGILPGGTGGDFRRSLKISTNVATAARTLRDGRPRLIDVGRVTFVNDAGERETRFFVNVGSFGMSTAVLERQRSGDAKNWVPWFGSRKIGSKLAYVAATVQTTFASAPIEVYVQLDDQAERSLRLAEL